MPPIGPHGALHHLVPLRSPGAWWSSLKNPRLTVAISDEFSAGLMDAQEPGEMESP